MKILAATLFLVFAFSTACGDDDGGNKSDGNTTTDSAVSKDALTSDGGAEATCSLEITPCGGEIVGTWSFSAFCFEDPDLECDAATTDLSNLVESGTVTFVQSKGNTVDIDVSLSGMVAADFPASCDFACDSEDCEVVGDGCHCEGPSPFPTIQESATWTTDGVNLTIEGSEFFEDESMYCVEGNQLKIYAAPPSTPYLLTFDRVR